MTVIVLPVAMGMPMMMGMPVIVMVVPVIMRVGVVMAVAVIVSMVMCVTVAVAGIGAAHRVEGRDDVLDLSAEPLEHGLDDVVAQDQDAVRRDRRGEMAVADVPGEFGKMQRIAGLDRIERLVGGGDLDQAAALDRQGISGGQHDGFGQIDQNLVAIDGFDHAPAQMPGVVLEDRATKHGLTLRGRINRAPDGYGFQHAEPRFRRGPARAGIKVRELSQSEARRQYPVAEQLRSGHSSTLDRRSIAKIAQIMSER